MSVSLETRPAPALSAAPATSQCTQECADQLDCAFCSQPLSCDHIRGQSSTVSSCDGPAHEDCHHQQCREPACWVDPDAAWKARHEW